MSEQRLKELQEERIGIIALQKTLVFMKWLLVALASAALTLVVYNFLKIDNLSYMYTGVGIIFFSSAALIDAVIMRTYYWVQAVDDEIAEIQKRHEQQQLF